MVAIIADWSKITMRAFYSIWGLDVRDLVHSSIVDIPTIDSRSGRVGGLT